MKWISGRPAPARRFFSVALCAGALALSGCGSDLFEYSYVEPSDSEKEAPTMSGDKTEPGIFGGDGIDFLGLFGNDKGGAGGAGGGSGIGVNSYLWRASLDTISFMPLNSADPFGGVIITDWYTPPESPAERFKMNVYILGRELRADGIRVAVFRQAQKGGGSWVDAAVRSETAINLENQILSRARQLRVASASTN